MCELRALGGALAHEASTTYSAAGASDMCFGAWIIAREQGVHHDRSAAARLHESNERCSDERTRGYLLDMRNHKGRVADDAHDHDAIGHDADARLLCRGNVVEPCHATEATIPERQQQYHHDDGQRECTDLDPAASSPTRRHDDRGSDALRSARLNKSA